MNIYNLPPEIWILIIKYLDLKSKINLFNTIAFRKFFVPSHFKIISLSRTTLATVRSLQADLFVDVAKYVAELNLSGVPDLTAEAFQPYVDKFENLSTLDVTYTRIDLSDVGKICPKTLRNININFFKCGRECFKGSEKWNCAKQVFIAQQFVHVHFIVFDYEDTRFPLLFLSELPRIQHLKVDIIHNDNYYGGRYSFNDPEELTDMNFSSLRYLFRDCDITNLQDHLQIDFEKVEYIFMDSSIVYVSPIFKHLFPMNSIVNVEKVLPNDVFTFVECPAIFHAWHKNTTIFDEKLFNSILQDYKDYFPTYICMQNMAKINILNDATNWYCLDNCDGFDKILETNAEKVTFTDYCNCCRIYEHSITESVTLIKFDQWDRIRNVTFLSLTHFYLGEDFFLNLFINCNRIITLNIDIDDAINDDPRYNFQDYMISLSNAVGHARCLKNLKLNIECEDYNVLFNVLSKCPSLENIYISDFDGEPDFSDINPANLDSLFKNCKNLYSLFIQGTTEEYANILYSTIYEIVQRLELFHLFVDIHCCDHSINPFEDVFNPSPLQILD